MARIVLGAAPFAPESLTGWYIGLAVGFAVVVIVVVVVAALLGAAARIAEQARTAGDAVARSRDNTEPLWELQRLNQSIRQLARDARSVRNGLSGR